MSLFINPVCLAAYIAGLLAVLINITAKFIGFIAKAIAKEPCRMNILVELIFAFIFSFLIALYFLL